MSINYPENWSAKEKADMDRLFGQARTEGLWFMSLGMLAGGYWFSPDELEAEFANGKFRWSAVNWALNPPSVFMSREEEKFLAAAKEFAKAHKRVHGAWPTEEKTNVPKV